MRLDRVRRFKAPWGCPSRIMTSMCLASSSDISSARRARHSESIAANWAAFSSSSVAKLSLFMPRPGSSS